MTVLCVVAHPDDEVLGVGGTLAAHARSGETVHVCILSNGVASRHDGDTETVTQEQAERKASAQTACERLSAEEPTLRSFPDNQFDSVPLVDLVRAVEAQIEKHRPDTVYTHHYGDLNVDHELTARAVVTATRPLADSDIQRVAAFETLSATEWGVPSADNAFQPTTFVDISETLEDKLDALDAYSQELRDHPHPRTVENVERSARLWGAKSGVPAAEPFELLREVRAEP
jgi:LmbE family N-acetylglucosaminyl deacetylase